ncbi:DNA repair protein SWI5 homolog [Vombatus ursinus]|uniref:DNA repair protein SWI5 homolog n=1 Tax=Vombatus ursinus TaxID=29139 RepID=A0A4X2L9E8_VOMUR|nr:DNA repair protein SWI5 homolog [Vombatus ursinus]
MEPRALQRPSGGEPGTPGLRRARLGLPKRHSAAFRSPVPTPKSGQADETSEDSLQLEIQELKQKRDTLDQEISQLMAEGYVVSELEDHISLLHEYNDIKDVGQMLMGKLASIRGVTTKELYPEFDLDMND